VAASLATCWPASPLRATTYTTTNSPVLKTLFCSIEYVNAKHKANLSWKFMLANRKPHGKPAGRTPAKPRGSIKKSEPTSSVSQAQAQKTTLPTEAQSLNLMRNLLGTTIGAITYLRSIFDEGAYQDHTVGGIALKGLSRKIDPEADTVIDLLEKGAYDALEKQYLRCLVFGIYLDEDKPDDLVEKWTFNFRYPNSKPHLAIEHKSNQKAVTHLLNPEELSKDNIRATTVQMLRTLVSLNQTLNPLPAKRFLTYKLYYYDSLTPADYEPPLFKPATTKEAEFPADAFSLKIGQVKTQYHDVGLLLHSNVPDPEVATQPAQPEPTPEKQSLRHESIEEFIHRGPVPSLPGDSVYSGFADTQALMDGLEDMPLEYAMTELKLDGQVSCPCDHNDTKGTLCKCTGCHMLVHTACHGFETSNAVPHGFFCLTCRQDRAARKVPGSTPADEWIDDRAIPDLCLRRRILVLCKESPKVERKTLVADLKLRQKVAFRALSTLIEEGALNKLNGNHKAGSGLAYSLVTTSEGKAKYQYYMTDACLEQVSRKSQEPAKCQNAKSHPDKPQPDKPQHAKPQHAKPQLAKPQFAQEHVVYDSEMDIETQLPPRVSESPELMSDFDQSPKSKVSVPAVNVRKRKHDADESWSRKSSVPKNKLK